MRRQIRIFLIILAVVIALLPAAAFAEESYITTTALPDVAQNKACSIALKANTTGLVWSVADNQLPEGLTLNSSTGVISGTPSRVGTYTFTVHASKGALYDAQTLSLYVSQAPRVNSSIMPLGAKLNTAYSFKLSAAGSNTITWSIVSGSLPSGLSLNATTGLISGTPTANGSFSCVVKAKNSVGESTRTVAIQVGPYQMPNAVVGKAYTSDFLYQYASSNHNTFRTSRASLASGSMPPGLTLTSKTNPDGYTCHYITGTPTKTGTYAFTIYSTYTASTFNFIITVCETPKLITASLPEGRVGKAYREVLEWSGTGNSTWTFADGYLPRGMSLDTANGIIQGTPSEPGTYTLNLTFSNSFGTIAKSFTLVIRNAPIISSAPNIGEVGKQYHHFLFDSGSDPATWSMAEGTSLPAGLTLNTQTGYISGIPTESGTKYFVLKATSNAGYDNYYSSITINPDSTAGAAPVINTTSMRDATLGTPYAELVSVTGTLPVEWRIEAEQLPQGLSFDRTTGRITGTPTVVGVHTFILRATNAYGTITKSITLRVCDKVQIIKNVTIPGGKVGTAYNHRLSAVGSKNITWSIYFGSLPTGLSLNASTGAITGTPSAAGNFHCIIKASNSVGEDSRTVDIKVASYMMPNAVVGKAYTSDFLYQYASSNHNTFRTSRASLVSGSMPPGLTLNTKTNSDGYTCHYITGTPSKSGTYAFALYSTYTATNYSFLITVCDPPRIITANLPEGRVGKEYKKVLEWTGTGNSTWTFVDGYLPRGMSLDTTNGIIQGTPTEPGTYTLYLSLNNICGTITKTYVFTVKKEPAIYTIPNDGVVGEAYRHTFLDEGTEAITWSIADGTALPAGLSLNPATGHVSGVPTAAGTTYFIVRATGNAGYDSYYTSITVKEAAAQGTAPAIIDSALNRGVVGESYSEYVTVTGTMPITWRLETEQMPEGLSFDLDNGHITGIPSVPGAYEFTVRATNAYGTITKKINLTVYEKPHICTSITIPGGQLGATYNHLLTATGSKNITWSIYFGSLPTGLTLDANTGVISGKPTAAGSFHCVVKAANSVGEDSRTVDIRVASYKMPNAVTGTAYTSGFLYQYASSDHNNFRTSRASFVSGSLPPGLTLTSKTNPDGYTCHYVTGKPSQAGTYTFTMYSSYTARYFGFIITVCNAPTIQTSSLPDGRVGKEYNKMIEWSGTGNSSWKLLNGNLPDGLSLNASHGIISGTPTLAGTYTFTLQMSNLYGVRTREYSILVKDTPHISLHPNNGIVNAPYRHTFAVSGSEAVTWNIVDRTALPTGLMLNKATGIITGTPTETGTTYFIVRATGAAGYDTFYTSITIDDVLNGVAPQITTSSINRIALNKPFIQEMTATGSAAIQWTLVDGELPPGITLDLDTGTLSGYASIKGSYQFSIRASNAFGKNIKTYTATVYEAPTIQTSYELPGGKNGIAYKHTLTAIGDDPITWSIYDGALPTGLVLSTSGIISGTPTKNGDYLCILKASNNVGYDIRAITIKVGSYQIDDAVLGKAYSSKFLYQYASSNHNTFRTSRASLVSGTMPPGLTLTSKTNPDGYTCHYITGTPSKSGTYAFTIYSTYTATNYDFVITVSTLPSIETTALPGGTVGTQYRQILEWTGTGSSSWTLINGTMPDGLSLNASTGVISGVPTTTGIYTFTIKMANILGSPSRTYTVKVMDAPIITSRDLHTGILGDSYYARLTAYGTEPITWSVYSGELPSGLTLNENTGEIKGTPSSGGSYNLSIKASNPAGYDMLDANIFIGDMHVPDGIVSLEYENKLEIEGEICTDWQITSGSLPTGLALNTATGFITGTPTVSGQYIFTVSASCAGAPRTLALSLTVNELPDIGTRTLPDGIVGNRFNNTLLVSTGTVPITWSLENGALPAGMYIDPVIGLVYGTPLKEGRYTFTVRATNTAGFDTQELSIYIPQKPEILSEALPGGTVGTAYRYGVSHIGSKPMTWSIQNGALPTGLTIDASSGIISGTPSKTGTYTVTLKVQNDAGYQTKTYNVYVGSYRMPNAVLNTPYTSGFLYQYASSNHNNFRTSRASFVSGTLPPGLTLTSKTNSDGYTCHYITGTPTKPGTYTFTMYTTYTAAYFVFTITVYAPPTITTTELPYGIIGNEYSRSLETPGTPHVTWDMTSGALPDGITLDKSTGQLYGTPTVDGKFTFVIKSSNVGGTQSKTMTMDVYSVPTIVTTSLSGGTKGEQYSTLLTSLGTMPQTWSIDAGTSLPDGLAINTKTGVISGTPTKAGVYHFTLRSTNAYGYTTRSMSISISGTKIPSGVMGKLYTAALKTPEETQTYRLYTGSLPPGLALDGATGVISGTPTVAGSFGFTLKSYGDEGTEIVPLSISIYAMPNITTASLPAATVSQPYTRLMSATGTTPMTWTLHSGTLPTGLSLDSQKGIISGTPSSSGTYSFVVKASNVAGETTKAYTIQVHTIPVITTSVLPGGILNRAYSYTLRYTGTGTPTWSIYSGALPKGLTLTASTGVISGTPTANGTFTFIVKAQNAGGYVLKTLSITVGQYQMPNAVVGTAYTSGFLYQYASSNHNNFRTSRASFVSGSLPPGLTLTSKTNPDGYTCHYITGKPSKPGTYTFTMYTTYTAAYFVFTITVYTPPDITSATLPGATVGLAYKHAVTESGTPPVYWLMHDGALPPGLSINYYTGEITGVPSRAGTYTVTLMAWNTIATRYKTLTLTVSEPIVFRTNVLPYAAVGELYAAPVSLSGTRGVQWSLYSGALPPGITQNASTGILSGTPTKEGVYVFTVKATNLCGYVTKQMSITVNGGSLPDGAVGKEYKYDPPREAMAYEWTLLSGALPAGLSLNVDTGSIYGTPTEKGNFAFTIRKEGGGETLLLKKAITIFNAPSIATTALATGVCTKPYQQILLSNDAVPAKWEVVSGTMPPGLVLDATTGMISGTPTEDGVFNTEFRLTSSGGIITKVLPITIYREPSIPTGELTRGTIGAAYSHVLDYTGTSPVTWTIYSNALPAGLTLNATTGEITGKPTATGTYYFRIKAQNAAGYTIKQMRLDVGYYQMPNAVVGTAYTSGFLYQYASSNHNNFRTSRASLASGSMPPGLTLTSKTNPDGYTCHYITGTPTKSGTYVFTIYTTYTSAYFVFSITVFAGPDITTSAITAATTGKTYKYTLNSSGTPPVYWRLIDGGSLPPGLSLNAYTGIISGTPSKAGTYGFVVKAWNSGAVRTKYLTLTVVDYPSIRTYTPPTGAVGKSYSLAVATTGTGSLSWSIFSGQLPPGLSLNTSTGVISGIPSKAGEYGFTIKALNPVGHDLRYMTIYIADEKLDDAITNTAYNQTIADDSFDWEWVIYKNALPVGLTLAKTTGEIAGTPYAAGNYMAEIRKENDDEAFQKSYAIDSYAAPSFVTTSLPYALVGQPYRQLIRVTAALPTKCTVYSGTLPTGMNLDENTGVIYGTPTLDGTYNFVVKAKTAAGSTRQSFTIIVYSKLAIMTTDLPSGLLNNGYSTTLQATSNTPVTWSLWEGALPAGLTLNASTGVISGKPTVNGTSSFILRAANSVDYNFKTLSITSGQIKMPDAVLNTVYTSGFLYQYASSNHNNFRTSRASLVSGSMPPGLTLTSKTNPDGYTCHYITGKPSKAGTYTFTIYTTYTAAYFCFSITVLDVPAIYTASLPGGRTGYGYSAIVQSTGVRPTTYRVSSGSLPAGVTLNAATGVISGTPSGSGTYTFGITAANPYSTNAKTFSIAIYKPPVISTASVADCTVGNVYSTTLAATGSSGITWSLYHGKLPTGLTLSSAGVISGTPTVGGKYDITVKATNAGGSYYRNYEFTCHAVPNITTSDLPVGLTAKAYNKNLRADSPTAVTWKLIGGALPGGLTLQSNGKIVGTVNCEEGDYNFTVSATNQTGTTTKALKIIITSMPVITTEPPLKQGIVGIPYSVQFAAESPTAVTWSLRRGKLPPGLTLSGTGLLSGTPTTPGTYSFRIRAKNVGSRSVQDYEIFVRVIYYYVAFDGNGATSGSMDSMYIAYDTEARLTTNAFAKQAIVTYNYNGNGKEETIDAADCIFKNWNTTATGNGTPYIDNARIKNLSNVEDSIVMMYAQWQAGNVLLPDATRNLYFFDGWYSAPEEGTKVGMNGEYFTTAKDITLYAHWDNTFEVNGITFKVTGEGTVEVTSKEFGEYSGAVVVPRTATYGGITYNVDGVGDGAFKDNDSLISVTLPDGMKYIGDEAFADCDNLVTVNIPSSITEIGKDAFKNCPNLQSVTIPKGVETIGDGAFEGDTSLKNITLPDTIKEIGDNAFKDSGLETIILPDSLEKIGDFAFANCDNLTTITIPVNVSEIGKGAFKDCDNLTEIKVSLGNRDYNSMNGVLYNKDNSVLICVPAGKSGEFVIPGTVKTIADYAFSGADKLTSIIIPEGVTVIGNYAFEDCSGLTKLIIPASVTTIGDYAFKGCSKLVVVIYMGDKPTTGTGIYTGTPATLITHYLCERDGWATGNWQSRGTRGLAKITVPYSVKLTGTSSSPLPGYYREGDKLTLSTTVKTGYHFEEWTVEGGSATIPKTNPATFDMPAADISVSASIEPNKYKIKYRGNGSTAGSMPDDDYTYDKEQALSENKYTRTFTVTYNYNGSGASNTTSTISADFLGWATSADTGVRYNDKQLVKNLLTDTGTFNLYAKWGEMRTTTPSPTRNGYGFAGWYTTSECTTLKAKGGVSMPVDGNIILYAKWVQNKLIITDVFPDRAYAGVPSIAFVTIRNDSVIPANDIVVSLKVAGQEFTNTANIPAGQTRTVSIKWTPPETSQATTAEIVIRTNEQFTVLDENKSALITNATSNVVNRPEIAVPGVADPDLIGPGAIASTPPTSTGDTIYQEWETNGTAYWAMLKIEADASPSVIKSGYGLGLNVKLSLTTNYDFGDFADGEAYAAVPEYANYSKAVKMHLERKTDNFTLEGGYVRTITYNYILPVNITSQPAAANKNVWYVPKWWSDNTMYVVSIHGIGIFTPVGELEIVKNVNVTVNGSMYDDAIVTPTFEH